MGVTSGYLLVPSVPWVSCQVLYPNIFQLPCAYLMSYLQSQTSRKQQGSWNIFLSPSPLASLACAEVSLFYLHDIHERHRLSLGHLQHLAWKRGYTRQPFTAYHLITQAKVILHLCQRLCLSVWGCDKCLVQKTLLREKMLFSLWGLEWNELLRSK